MAARFFLLVLLSLPRTSGANSARVAWEELLRCTIQASEGLGQVAREVAPFRRLREDLYASFTDDRLLVFSPWGATERKLGRKTDCLWITEGKQQRWEQCHYRIPYAPPGTANHGYLYLVVNPPAAPGGFPHLEPSWFKEGAPVVSRSALQALPQYRSAAEARLFVLQKERVVPSSLQYRSVAQDNRLWTGPPPSGGLLEAQAVQAVSKLVGARPPLERSPASNAQPAAEEKDPLREVCENAATLTRSSILRKALDKHPPITREGPTTSAP